MLTLSLLDLVVIWLFPLIAATTLYLLLTLVVYLALHTALWPRFSEDIHIKIRRKQKLPSGSGTRFSYFYLLALLTLDNGMQATFLYRVSRFLLLRQARGLAEVCHSFAKFLTHIDISPAADIGAGLTFYHGLGAVIGKNSRIGAHAIICQNVTLGGGRPQIGDNVIIWAGAKLLGNISIGDGAEIGANAVVIDDVPANCIAVGVPAKRFIPRGESKADSASSVQVSVALADLE